MKAQERARPKLAGSPSKPAYCEDENENNISVPREGPTQRIFDPERVETVTSLSHAPDSISKPQKSPPDVQNSESYASPLALKPGRPSKVGADSPQTAPVGANEKTTSLVSPPTSLSDDMESAVSQFNISPDISLPDQRSSHVHTSPSTVLIDEPSVKISLQESHVQSETLPDSSPTNDPPVRLSRTKLSSPTNSPPKPAELRAHVNALKSPRRPRRTSPLSDRKLPGRQSQDDQSHRHSKASQRDLMEVDADPESLRLIKELQEQEFSLRKRATRS